MALRKHTPRQRAAIRGRRTTPRHAVTGPAKPPAGGGPIRIGRGGPGKTTNVQGVAAPRPGQATLPPRLQRERIRPTTIKRGRRTTVKRTSTRRKR